MTDTDNPEDRDRDNIVDYIDFIRRSVGLPTNKEGGGEGDPNNGESGVPADVSNHSWLTAITNGQDPTPLDRTGSIDWTIAIESDQSRDSSVPDDFFDQESGPPDEVVRCERNPVDWVDLGGSD